LYQTICSLHICPKYFCAKARLWSKYLPPYRPTNGKFGRGIYEIGRTSFSAKFGKDPALFSHFTQNSDPHRRQNHHPFHRRQPPPKNSLRREPAPSAASRRIEAKNPRFKKLDAVVNLC